MPEYSQYDVPNSNEMINFGVGQPDTSKLPIDWFNLTLQKLAKQNLSSEILQYGAISGYDKIKTNLSKWLTQKYYSFDKYLDVSHTIIPEKIFMSNGNTGALQLIMTTFIETGDEIIIEEPTYLIAKNMFDEYALNIHTVSMESDGLNIEELEQQIISIIKGFDKYPQNKIFLYTVPIHHNPTSITLSHEKRQQLANLCIKYPQFHIIADEVYHFLSFESLTQYPLADYHPNILSLGSFSKLIAPSLRVGWIYQNCDFESSLLKTFKNSAILDSSGGMNPIGYLILNSALEDGSINTIIENNIKMLSERCNLMCEYLSINNEITFNTPKGGYFLWLNMNINDTTKFLNFASMYKIKFHPGIKFGDNSKNYIRLSFSYYDSNDLILGLERLLHTYNLYNKIKVSIYGETGKLGQLIKNELINNKKFYINEAIKREINIDLGSDVLIDVSSKEGTYSLIKYLLDNKINKPIIIGTTGLSNEIHALIKKYSLENPVALISNFSEGVSKINKLLKELNNLGVNWKFSMVEKHHTQKTDQPSGTAKSLSKIIDRPCNIESIRTGDIIGYHEIKIESEEEEIIISHNAKSRKLFAKGCIKYISWIIKKDPGIYHEIDETYSEYYIINENDNQILITENKNLDYITNISKTENIDYYVTLEELENREFLIQTFDDELINVNYSIDIMKGIAKYINKYYDLESGQLSFITNSEKITLSFKFENKNITMEVLAPIFRDLNDSFIQNLTMLITQLSGLQIIGIAKYLYNGQHLIIEVKDNIKELDTEIISTLGTIINSEKSYDKQYHAHFISSNNTEIIIRSYNKDINKEAHSTEGCIISFYYIAFNNNLNNNFSYPIISKENNIFMFYNNKKYYYNEL